MIARSLALATGLLLAGTAFAQMSAPSLPPAPKIDPVTDSYYGTSVTDNYRYFENLSDPAVSGWMKAQGHYTAAVMDSIPGRAALLKKVGDYTASFDFVQSIQLAGGRTFYEERAPGTDQFSLLVREADGTKRMLIDTVALRAANGGTPYAVNYFAASPDGTKVAVGTSSGGSEDAKLTVYDVATVKPIAGPLDRARFGVSGWSDDGRILYINLLADLPPGAPPTEKYQNSVAYAWDLKGPPIALLSSKTSGPIKVPPAMFPVVAPIHGASIAIAALVNGTQNEREIWTAPAGAAPSAGAPWTKLAAFDDGVTALDASGDTIYLLSHQDAPTFKVLTLKAGQPLSAATVMIASRPDRLIEGIGVASDGVYVRARHGLYSELIRIPLGGGAEQMIALPLKGSIAEMFTDPAMPGATIQIEGWTTPPTELAYDPKNNSFANLPLGSNPAGFVSSAYAVSDLHATAKDGVKVPLSYVEKVGAKHPAPLLLWAYGSYGITQFAAFSSRATSMLQEGISYALCHVRGGGELGEAWRLGGKDATKYNTWRDLIACGEELIAKGYTTKDKLFIGGGSAGGITMGRAMEERPDLFAGVFDMVPAANAVRQEFSPNGVPNIPEFGTVTTEAGFKNLLMMDSYLNVKDGVQYPAIMITTGLNDPRVSSWEPAKLAARLQASGTKNPVLLRIDEQAGHGIGSTKSQNDAIIADQIALIKWRAREPGWAPTVAMK